MIWGGQTRMIEKGGGHSGAGANLSLALSPNWRRREGAGGEGGRAQRSRAENRSK
jgi:hypothetical protein